MILQRLILGTHLRVLLAVAGVLLVLATLLDFFEQARPLLSGKGSGLEIFSLILLKVPSWLHLLLPVALVASTCITFAILGSSLQLRALAAAGVSPFRLLVPVLEVTALVVMSMVLMQELLVPPALDRMEALMMKSFGRFDATWQFFRSHQWYQGDDGRLFRVLDKSADGATMYGVTVLTMDRQFHVQRREDYSSLLWQEDQWHGNGALIRRFDQGRLLDQTTLEQNRPAWTEGPDRFRDLSGRPQQKKLGQLARDIGELEKRGLETFEYQLAWHNRFAYPLIGVGLILFLFPWLSAPNRRRALSGALTESMALTFAGYFLVTVCTSAVSGGMLSPPWGAWLPVLIILFMAFCSWVWWRRQGRKKAE